MSTFNEKANNLISEHETGSVIGAAITSIAAIVGVVSLIAVVQPVRPTITTNCPPAAQPQPALLVRGIG